MGRFPVSKQTEDALVERMARIGMQESDLDEQFIRGSGAGGQKINKTSSCVLLTHRPTGLQVRCQRERSQALNRFLARRILCEKLEAQILGRQSQRQQEIERTRRQKRRRTRRGKAKMLASKRHRATIKAGRKPPANDSTD